MTSDAPRFEGGCYCGAVRYVATGKPVFKAQCHCRECQYISGGGPNYFMLLPAAGLTWTAQEPEEFTRTDLDHAVTRRFCGACGTHLSTHIPDQETFVLKVGRLDDPTQFGAPKAAIYTCDAQGFHEFPKEIPKFDRLPPR